MLTGMFCFLIFGVPLLASEQCGPNEIFDSCGTACPATCQIPHPGNCPEICVPGCFCQPGFIRESRTGPCVEPGKCETACRENEFYDKCGIMCPPTCLYPVRGCDKVCSPGCFCKEGFVLEDASQICVEQAACPNSL